MHDNTLISPVKPPKCPYAEADCHDRADSSLEVVEDNHHPDEEGCVDGSTPFGRRNSRNRGVCVPLRFVCAKLTLGLTMLLLRFYFSHAGLGFVILGKVVDG